MKDFTEAIKLKPDFARAYFGRNLTYRKLKMKTEAAADLKKAKELDSGSK